MRAKLTMVLAMLGSFATASAFADDGNLNLSVKRQIVLCMTKSMSANKTLSYSEAERDCKQTLAARNTIPTAKRALTANAADTPALKNP